ncbi:ligase-associated DNA damage response exonuclease [Tautonia plasticadhaerens]|uniref:Metallo-beta-lactamase superfamily protein n=1 Tax=Tautonia plasticadhaerens TaxID=2527974 RepID=A0A518HCL4_9BACT|nr:ligase-associated DNA damage response exonuclease [Tautonia plasticadhaerens]QDV38602.1 Metallo-beta-lactamase superfamily protein [Tautonia plasticadhaerens]
MTRSDPVLRLTDAGLYCEAGDFFIDPWCPVDRAVITHAHSDHARWGSRRYLTARDGAGVLRVRVGDEPMIEAAGYGDPVEINGVRVSLHPAGHILGSAQVRVEHRGAVWVVSGDYKVGPDATCVPFDPVRCHVFITESTFALPIYRWPSQRDVFDSVNAWWRSNADSGKVSLLFSYALGKAQRLLSGLDPSIGPIFCHGAVEKLNAAYRATGIPLPPTSYAGTASNRSAWARGIVVAPPSAHGTPWARKFGPSSSAFASGWMTIRGTRRRRAVDRGFVLSDHADWPGLLDAIAATGAETVWATHGYSAVLVRWLREHGTDAHVVATRFVGEEDASAEPEDGSAEEAG